MIKVKFPAKLSQRYYDTHYMYMLNIFKYAGCDVSFYQTEGFTVFVGGKKVFIDFADYSHTIVGTLPCFKFHIVESNMPKDVFPFSPISFYDWDEYYTIMKTMDYKAKGYVVSRQRPHCNNKIRRTDVQNLLRANLKEGVQTAKVLQKEFWDEVNTCLVSVCVPGQNNNMIDRGQLQYMAFGACTISPNLPETLPFNKTFVDGEHYIKCADNYSDLLDKIAWCKNNTEKCIEIGKNAQQLFLETSTPKQLLKWIEQNI